MFTSSYTHSLIHPSNHPSKYPYYIHPSTIHKYLSTQTHIHPSVYPYTHPPIHTHTHPSIQTYLLSIQPAIHLHPPTKFIRAHTRPSTGKTSIHPCTDPSINTAQIHQSTHPSILTICQYAHPSIHPFFSAPIHQFTINPSIHQSIHFPINPPTSNSSTHPPIHSSNYSRKNYEKKNPIAMRVVTRAR